MRIIINADDLGASARVNNAVFDLMSRKKITSATILANGPAFDDAVERIHHFPECSFGAHLNVTQFRPLKSNADLSEILDDEGEIIRLRMKKIAIGRNLKHAVFEEWCSQIEKIRSRGVEISHIDSHDSVHNLPQLFFVLKRVQKHLGIRKVRTTLNIYSSPIPGMLMLKKRLWQLALRTYYRTKTTSGFADFHAFLEAAKKTRLRHRDVELMVHPGSDYSAEETVSLLGSWRREMPFEIELINYNQL